ncbi:hypothetical protein H6G11_08600 [Cyanobacterium aponinum FACHB-4101]|uniref:hypothetical protein n=1 Tax=Cyanobacterium aponinum TaxID=379064 RepID=UPI001680FC4A|nr:hypothetical protein [Cyanobacterium aponinum]MBD2394316.1 hypothetical protein [Cyanobacterium aponinum FACHB-4101]
MVTHFSVDTSVNIPATVNDFIKHLSEGFGVSDVYLGGDIDEVRQFILSHLHMVRGIKDVDGERQEGFLKNSVDELIEYISIITLPYLERENQVNLSIVGDTLYGYDSQGIAVSFVNIERLVNYLQQGLPLLAIDGVHVGTSIPHPVGGLINPKILTDKPIYQASAHTAIRQADVGVKEIVGQLWRGNIIGMDMNKIPVSRDKNYIMPVMGTAFLWNLIICNGNRPIPTPEETTVDYLLQRKTDCWFPTYTYRCDPEGNCHAARIYEDNLLPSKEIRKEIQDGHCFSIKVTGALRASLYHLNPIKPLIIEPHSYSGFSHEFLNQYVGKSLLPQDWLPLAKKENALRPLVSVLDVQKLGQDGYWTTTQEEAERFYQGFLQELKSHWHELPFIEGIPESMNDVYGYGGGILTRLTQVIEQASYYANTDFESIKTFYEKNILTVEINRLLVQLSEFEDVSCITEEVYLQRCQIVGNAFMAGIKNMLNY